MKEGPGHTLHREGNDWVLVLSIILGQEREMEAWPQGRENTVRTSGWESKASACSRMVGDPWEKGWLLSSRSVDDKDFCFGISF